MGALAIPRGATVVVYCSVGYRSAAMAQRLLGEIHELREIQRRAFHGRSQRGTPGEIGPRQRHPPTLPEAPETVQIQGPLFLEIVDGLRGEENDEAEDGVADQALSTYSKIAQINSG